jgi:hypothetical protein
MGFSANLLQSNRKKVTKTEKGVKNKEEVNANALRPG